jgi:hypothetical protein
MDTAELDWDGALREDETTRVIEWRQRRLLSLGYPPASATLLACAPVDIHDIERLVEQGCPLDLAIKIAA